MSKSTRKYANTEELEYLENKRKELHFTQDNFAELFSMSGNVYNKYINNSRCLDMSTFRMMKIILEYYELADSSINSISVSNYLESLRNESLISVFNQDYRNIVNIIFDFIIRNVKDNLR